MASTQDRVIAYCKTISPETRPSELLAFCGEVESDPLLMPLPIIFFAARGGNVSQLVDTAHAERNDDAVAPFLTTLTRCIQCRTRGRDYVRAAYELALDLAGEWDDEAVAVAARQALAREGAAEWEKHS